VVHGWEIDRLLRIVPTTKVIGIDQGGRLVVQAKHHLTIGSLQHDTNRANNIVMQGDVTDLVQLRQIKQSLLNNPPEFMVVVNPIFRFDVRRQVSGLEYVGPVHPCS
jgi:hypothetical protein